jgi:hypothetical protein
MKWLTHKRFILWAATIVLCICIYAFLLGNKVFRGEFENDAISWYILAKGIFCSLMLLLSVTILDLLKRGKK